MNILTSALHREKHMSDTKDLEARMNAVVDAVKEKTKANQQAMLQAHLERQKALKS